MITIFYFQLFYKHLLSAIILLEFFSAVVVIWRANIQKKYHFINFAANLWFITIFHIENTQIPRRLQRRIEVSDST